MWQLHFPLNKGKQEQVMDPFLTPESYLFQVSYTENSAISMIYGGHFEFWRPSWVLKRC